MDTLSIVVPCYNEDEALPIFYENICAVMRDELPQLTLALVLVNDGSKDGTLAAMRALAEQDERVKYLSFSRTFGKEAAM